MGSKLTSHHEDLPNHMLHVTRNRRDFTQRRGGIIEEDFGNLTATVNLSPSTSADNALRPDSNPNTTEKCYDPNDTTITFVDKKDEMDFYYNNYTSLRAKMSCGHAVTPMSLTDWCLIQLEQGATKFICGQTCCNAEWPYSEVCKMGLLTPKEKRHFEEKLFTNAAKHLNVKSCPGCRCRVIRHDANNLCVKCPECTVRNQKPYKFCWQCLKEWKGPVPVSNRCENDGCCSVQLEILRNCPVIKFKKVQGVKGCPSIRACPTCGSLLEHSTYNCKFIVCTRCKAKFCFVCLKLFPVCHNYFELCPSGVAPRQTSVPVWTLSRVS